MSVRAARPLALLCCCPADTENIASLLVSCQEVQVRQEMKKLDLLRFTTAHEWITDDCPVCVIPLDETCRPEGLARTDVVKVGQTGHGGQLLPQRYQDWARSSTDVWFVRLDVCCLLSKALTCTCRERARA